MAIEAWTGTYEDLPLGAEESASQLIDGSAIDAFANAIQSFNPVHMDGDLSLIHISEPTRPY